MIFSKQKKIKELNEQLNNPNITPSAREEINKESATLKSEKRLPWGWIVGAAIFILIIIFVQFIAMFVKHRAPVRRRTMPRKTKPAVRYNPADFIVSNKPKNKKQPKNAYAKLNGEISILKKKLKKGGSYVRTETGGGTGKAILIFVNPEYLKRIKTEEGIQTPTQIAKTAMKGIPAGAGKTALNPAAGILIPDGAVVSAYTKYELYSYNTKVPVIAVVSNPYSFKGKVIIPAGYEFMGAVSGHTKSRLDVSFNQLINPSNGESVAVNAIGIMPNGSAGIVGDAHYHVIQNVLAGIGAGVLGATAMFAGGGSAMNSTGAYTYQDTIRQNVAQNEAGYAQNSLNNATQNNNQVVITLPAKTAIKIMFMKALTR